MGEKVSLDIRDLGPRLAYLKTATGRLRQSLKRGSCVDDEEDEEFLWKLSVTRVLARALTNYANRNKSSAPAALQTPARTVAPTPSAARSRPWRQLERPIPENRVDITPNPLYDEDYDDSPRESPIASPPESLLQRLTREAAASNSCSSQHSGLSAEALSILFDDEGSQDESSGADESPTRVRIPAHHRTFSVDLDDASNDNADGHPAAGCRITVPQSANQATKLPPAELPKLQLAAHQKSAQSGAVNDPAVSAAGSAQVIASATPTADVSPVLARALIGYANRDKSSTPTALQTPARTVAYPSSTAQNRPDQLDRATPEDRVEITPNALYDEGYDDSPRECSTASPPGSLLQRLTREAAASTSCSSQHSGFSAEALSILFGDEGSQDKSCDADESPTHVHIPSHRQTFSIDLDNAPDGDADGHPSAGCSITVPQSANQATKLAPAELPQLQLAAHEKGAQSGAVYDLAVSAAGSVLVIERPNLAADGKAFLVASLLAICVLLGSSALVNFSCSPVPATTCLAGASSKAASYAVAFPADATAAVYSNGVSAWQTVQASSSRMADAAWGSGPMSSRSPGSQLHHALSAGLQMLGVDKPQQVTHMEPASCTGHDDCATAQETSTLSTPYAEWYLALREKVFLELQCAQLELHSWVCACKQFSLRMLLVAERIVQLAGTQVVSASAEPAFDYGLAVAQGRGKSAQGYFKQGHPEAHTEGGPRQRPRRPPRRRPQAAPRLPAALQPDLLPVAPVSLAGATPRARPRRPRLGPWAEDAECSIS